MVRYNEIQMHYAIAPYSNSRSNARARTSHRVDPQFASLNTIDEFKSNASYKKKNKNKNTGQEPFSWR